VRSSLWLLLLLFITGCPNKEAVPTGGHRLTEESSPYLRQHADNLVEWYPWGEAAFEKAKREDKPVFLSIGYSTCHWCHVMEEESFQDPEVADYLNQHFVSVKVDRETRPDVDQIYMNYVQRTTGSGGWPLTVFLTPERMPFYGGTYFPNPPKYNKIGFLDLLHKVHEAWSKDRSGLLESADKVDEELKKEAQSVSDSEIPAKEVLKPALESFRTRYDKEHRGFLPAPKFPSPPDLDFLLRTAELEGDEQARQMVFHTLEAMALGGLRDQLAGGFHRYSTDEEWLVPHFEKMLYDQAQLVSLYSQAYAVNRNPLFREAAESTLSYLDTSMRSPEGAFYSAEDADSEVPGNPDEHAEGAYYVWSYQELKEALSEDELAKCLQLFGVTEAGNASGDVAGELAGKNVLRRTTSDVDTEALVGKLLALREQRPRPGRDDKILTEWNALAAAALADAGRYLGNPNYIEESAEVLGFIESKLVVEGALKRSYFDEKVEIEAFCSDYVTLVHAYLTLYQAAGNPDHLLRAVHWQRETDQIFWDEAGGGYFDTRSDTELPIRRKTLYDGAEMSANGRAALNLTQLYELTGDDRYGQRLEKQLKLFAPILKKTPAASPGALCALLSWYSSHESVVVVSGEPQWWEPLAGSYAPQRVLLRVASAEERAKLAVLVPFLPPWSEVSQAYLCRDFTCGLPERSLEAVKKWSTEVVPAQP
jgi:uncharacterized protein YyaL (SSP411 family)